jgi:BolA family transcriptional regulator, general stress-responsive regulator
MSRNQERIALFLADLNAALPIDRIAIEDESHLHAGHAGAASGGGHFKLTLVSSAFDGLNRVSRHRLIYAALNRHIPAEIHALTIEAHSPAEALLLK